MREIVTVAVLRAMGTAAPQLKVHSRRALNLGRKRAEIFAECARG